MADKYQAIRKRSHIPHEKVMEIYKGTIERKFNDKNGKCVNGEVEFENVARVKNIYLTALERIDENRETLEKEIELDEFSTNKKMRKAELFVMKKDRRMNLEKTKKEREGLLESRDVIENWDKESEK